MGKNLIKYKSLLYVESSSAKSPIGMQVPHGGSSCTGCMYKVEDDALCANKNYINSVWNGKEKGEAKFIDGKTGSHIKDPDDYCCNFFDWTKSG